MEEDKTKKITKHHSQTSFTRLLTMLIDCNQENLAIKLINEHKEFDPNFVEEGNGNQEQEHPIFIAYNANMPNLAMTMVKNLKTPIDDVRSHYTDESFPFYCFMSAYKVSAYNKPNAKNRVNFALDVLKETKNINMVDSCGSTILHYACEDPLLLPIVQYICSREDADLSVQDYDGSTPLDIAAYSQNRQAVKFLAEKKTEKLAGVKISS